MTDLPTNDPESGTGAAFDGPPLHTKQRTGEAFRADRSR